MTGHLIAIFICDHLPSFVCLPLSLSLSLSLYIYIYIYISLSVCVRVCLSLSLSLSLCVCVCARARACLPGVVLARGDKNLGWTRACVCLCVCLNAEHLRARAAGERCRLGALSPNHRHKGGGGGVMQPCDCRVSSYHYFCHNGAID